MSNRGTRHVVSESRSNTMRRRRLKIFESMVEDGMSILDIGGTAPFWRQSAKIYGNPTIKVTIVNPEVEEGADDNLLLRAGDGCDLNAFADGSFDIVHSNSVIEHVGDADRMQAFAREVRRLAPRYFVQTPNFWFPIEPHHKLPFVHWVPAHARAKLLRAMGRVPSDPTRALAAVERIRLLDGSAMRRFFPDAELVPETMLGLTKSWMAIRK